MSNIALSAIDFGQRVRKDMGDVRALAESITKHGLLHPVVVTKDHLLVAGARRIEAVRLLGWHDVPVTVVDVEDLLSAERDENTERKDFTPTEAVAIGLLIEEQQRPKALEAKREAGRKAAAVRRGERVAGQGTATNRLSVSDKVANALGMDRKRYVRAKDVVAAAEADPEAYGDLPARMDETGNVQGAHQELIRRGGGKKGLGEKSPPRHAVHKKAPYPKPNLEMQRAVAALAGICMGLESVEIDKLDPTQTTTWSEALKQSAALIGRIARRVADVKAA